MKSPKFLIRAHQTKDRIDTPNKNYNIAIFDNLDLRKYYVEVDGQRSPRDGVSIKYTEYDFIDQYRDLKRLFHEYIGEPILNPPISYPDMKTKYSIGIIDLRHQLDHIIPKNFNYFKNMVLILTMVDCF